MRAGCDAGTRRSARRAAAGFDPRFRDRSSAEHRRFAAFSNPGAIPNVFGQEIAWKTGDARCTGMPGGRHGLVRFRMFRWRGTMRRFRRRPRPRRRRTSRRGSGITARRQRTARLRDEIIHSSSSGGRAAVKGRRRLPCTIHDELRSARRGFTLDRAPGRHRDHRRADRLAAAGRAVGSRGRAADAVHQQPQADRPGDEQLSRCLWLLPAGRPVHVRLQHQRPARRPASLPGASCPCSTP